MESVPVNVEHFVTTLCNIYQQISFKIIPTSIFLRHSIKHYFSTIGILSSGAEDFENSDEIYDAIGEVLHEVASNKTEDDIRSLCTKFHTILKPHSNGTEKSQMRKILAAPVHLGEMAEEMTSDVHDMKSIWMQGRNEVSKVDAKKLEKAEAKLQQKQEKREGNKPTTIAAPVLQTASASQVLSKKDTKMDAKGQSRSMDIRIENFDVAFGDKVLLQSADLILSAGRRYGFVGELSYKKFGPCTLDITNFTNFI